MSQFLLKLDGITKSFPGIKALDNVSFEVIPGEVLALVGENGAGKSTLIKILGGIYHPDKGDLYFSGQKVSLKSVESARKMGVSIIHQELVLAPNMSVADNIFLGREKGKAGFVNFSRQRTEAQAILDQFGLDFDARTLLGHLSVSRRQLVEIAKALSQSASLLIMDEPTASLTTNEAKALGEKVKEIAQKGVTVLYVSHRMEEIFQICDRVVVLRDGQYVGSKRVFLTSQEEVIRMMVGRPVASHEKKSYAGKEILLQAESIGCKGAFSNVSFELRKGEILGIAGLMGSGRTEILHSLFGISPIDEGTIFLRGEPVSITSVHKAIEMGFALIPEDRKKSGLVMTESVGFNLTLQVLQQFINFRGVNRRRENRIIHQSFCDLDIHAPSARTKISSLSGGNQQKVVLGKWMAADPEILLLDEPTRGIDIASKRSLYNIIERLVANGISVIIVSSEFPELLNISDRVLVIHRGYLTKELSGDDISKEQIMRYATGTQSSKLQEDLPNEQA